MSSEDEPRTCPECGEKFGETEDCLPCALSRSAADVLLQMEDAT